MARLDRHDNESEIQKTWSVEKEAKKKVKQAGQTGQDWRDWEVQSENLKKP